MFEDLDNLNPVDQLWRSRLVSIEEAVARIGLGLEAHVYFAKLAVQSKLAHGLTLDEVWPSLLPRSVPHIHLFSIRRLW